MEFGDIGIKGPDDLVECLEAGASLRDLYEAHGDRIGGMIAYLADELYRSLRDVSKECADDVGVATPEEHWALTREELLKRINTP